MNQRSKKKSGFWRFLRSVSAVDKILMILMLLLFIQFLILLTEDPTQDAQPIDIVFRSAAAMIFGYFIGGINADSGPGETTDAVSRMSLKGNGSETPVAKIGFTSEPQAVSAAAEDKQPPRITQRPERQRALQIWVAGGIALLSILILLLVRNMDIFHENLGTDSGIATLSQLRDFASGSIGFLVSASARKEG